MQPQRFDRLARSTAGLSRRSVLGVAALLGVLGMASSARDASARKCKPNCGVCEKCVKGKCKAKPGGARCGGSCNECRGGVCAVKDDGASCGVCRACHFGACGKAADGTKCPGKGSCQDETCYTPPRFGCDGSTDYCVASTAACPGRPGDFCYVTTSGDPICGKHGIVCNNCTNDSDCAAGRRCVSCAGICGHSGLERGCVAKP
jgi:hypothetical protein